MIFYAEKNHTGLLLLLLCCVLDIQREEKNVQKSIKESAKRNDMGSAKVIPLRLRFISLVRKFIKLLT